MSVPTWSRVLSGYRRYPGPWRWMVALTCAYVAVLFIAPGLTIFATPAQYLPIHLLAEFLSGAVSIMVFALAWNVRHSNPSNEMYILGLGSLMIAAVDIGHTLAFPGMPDLITASSTEKAINFWLVGRLVAALALLLVAAMPERRWSSRSWNVGLAIAIAVAAAVLWIGLWHPDWVPDTYVVGKGLTTFKIAAEIVLSVLYVVAAVLFVRRANRVENPATMWLAAASWTLALAELIFAVYRTANDSFNVMGHAFKLLAYLMVYRALFVEGVLSPYRQLSTETSRLRSLINSVPDLIWFKGRDGVYLGANRAYADRLSLTEEDIVGCVQPSGQQPDVVAADTDDAEVIHTGHAVRLEQWLPYPDGTERLFDTVKTTYTDENGTTLGLVGISRDITDQRRAEDRLWHLANYDQLTGLPNRIQHRERGAHAVAEALARGGSCGLIFLDLDDFKTINDTMGHAVGDAVLRTLTDRLTEVVGSTGSLARLGGDEFAVLLPTATRSDVDALAEALLDAFRTPVSVAGYDLTLSCSVGAGLAPADASEFPDLARCAESAMYRAKSSGRNTYRSFTADMHQASAARLQLVSDLHRALASEEFVLHYQPQVRMVDSAVVAVEALARWQHPRQGLLAPGSFIDVCESTGLIVPLGGWVLTRALRDMGQWLKAGLGLERVAVNISALQFRQPDFASHVADALALADVPASALELEITESLSMAEPERVAATIEQLHEIGVTVAIDDFGTGYSSMAYLRRFRVDRLKIDRAFVRDLELDSEAGAIVEAMLTLSTTLHCETIAEGVETAEQWQWLRRHGCEIAQGYLLSRPVSGEELPAALSAASATASGASSATASSRGPSR